MEKNEVAYQNALKFFNLKDGFTREDLNKVYKPLIAKWHTDVNKSEEAIDMSKKINEAFDILKRSLLNKENNYNLLEIEKQYLNERENFLNDIKKLQTKYQDYNEIIRICERFFNNINIIHENDNIKLPNKLLELRSQKKEFNERIEFLKSKINFQISKDNFLKLLTEDRNIKQINEIIKLSVLYQERLNDIYNLEDLKNLEKEYHEEKEKIKQEEFKKLLNQNINDSIKRINALKEKYENIKINNLIELYILKLKECKDLGELKKIENQFQREVNIILDEMEKIFNLKNILLSILIKYENMYLDSKDLLISYRDKVNESNNLEELINLDKEIKELSIKIENKENEKKEQVIKIKDQLKRITLYKFYKSSINLSIKDILEYKDLLKKVFEVIDKVNYDTLKEIEILVENINYNNLKIDKSNIELYLLTISDTLKNKDSVKEYVMNNSSNDSELFSNNNEMNQVKRDLINKILENYYISGTKASLKENSNILDSLTNVFMMLEEMSDKELYENADSILKINFSNLEEVKKILKELGMGSKVFISFKTGNVYTKEILNNDVILTPIDLESGITVTSREDFERNYISLNDFFRKATYVDEREVLERTDRYNVRRTLYNPDQKFLYFYNQLMLKCLITNDANLHKFEFLPSKNVYGWSVSESVLIRDNRYSIYKDREFCEKKVLEEIENQIKLNKTMELEEETFDF